MQEILDSTTDNATSSWYGFEVQGRIGLLYFLKTLKELRYEEWGNLFLEYEYMEDFAIGIKEEDRTIYKDIYQVKARKKLENKNLIKVYGELGFKKAIIDNINVHLISMCNVQDTVDKTECIKSYIKKYEDETNVLKEYTDINIIRENLKITNSKSNLKTIRSIVRKRFKEVEDIKDVNEIKEYCDSLLNAYEKYKRGTDDIEINIIIEKFEEINSNIAKNINYILKELEPDKVYKQNDNYINKIIESLSFLISTSLENYILKNDKLIFSISCNEILNIILDEKEKIEELHYLYLNNETLQNELQDYCLDCEMLDECNNDCEVRNNCELNTLLRNIRWMSLDKFKSLILNCNPDICRKDSEFNIWTSVVERNKLHNFIFDEIRKNKYFIQDKDKHTYLKHIDANYLFSFIDIEKPKKLLRDLENNIMYNRNIYEDNDAILNRKLKFRYIPGQILSKNQHWEEGREEQKNSILPKGIDFIRFEDIGGNDETSNQ